MLCKNGNKGLMAGSKWQLLVEIVALGVLGMITTRCFGFTDGLAITIGMAVAYAVPRLLFSRMSCYSRKGSWLLLAVGLMVITFAVINLWDWTVGSGGTMQNPHLLSDDSGYFHWAQHHYDGSCHEPRMTFKGLSVTILLLWKVLGMSLVWPIALNVMMLLLSIVLTGATAVRVVGGKVRSNSGVIAFIAMLMTSLLGFYVSQAMRVQKEAGLYLGVALMAYGLARMAETQVRSKLWRDVVAFTVGAFILAFYRSNMLYFITAGVLVMLIGNWRRHWRFGLMLLGICVVAFTIGFLCSSYTMLRQMNILTGGGRMSEVFQNGPTQSPYRSIIGNYFDYPVWKRLLLLPVTSAVQYVIPFPWVYEFQAHIEGWLPRVRVMWYIVGGMVLYYYLFIGWRKDRGVGSWGLLPAVCYLGVCYIIGGTVSRYVLPFQPLFVVVATFVCCKLRDGLWRHSFRGWMVGYVLVLAAVLVLCYNLQMAYFDEMEKAYDAYRKLHGL